MLCLFLVHLLSVLLFPCDASGPVDPQSIAGLKWKHTGSPAAQVSFETAGLDYAEAAQGLVDNGVTDIVLKVAEMKILPAGTTIQQRDAEVIAMLGAIQNASAQNASTAMNVYLWERKWMQRGGSDPTTDKGGQDFCDEMGGLINKAKAAGVDDVLQGVAVIENNLVSAHQVRERALFVATEINRQTADWLKGRDLFFPGAAMGSYFKGIQYGQQNWLAAMQAQVGYFSFIYKHMKSQAAGACSLAPAYADWDVTVGRKSNVSVPLQQAYLRGAMGVADLEGYLGANRAAFPTVCNAVFWGDSGDGITGMSSANVQAVHGILRGANGWRGSFLDLPYGAAVGGGGGGGGVSGGGGGSTSTGTGTSTSTGITLTGKKDYFKMVLTVNQTTGEIAKNTADTYGTRSKIAPAMTVWEEWERWSWQSPQY